MSNNRIPSPCPRDCINRTESCKSNCKRWALYAKIKMYDEDKKKRELKYRDENYISRDDIFNEYVEDSKKKGRDASNYAVR